MFIKINLRQKICDFEIFRFERSFMLEEGTRKEHPTTSIVNEGYRILHTVLNLITTHKSNQTQLKNYCDILGD